MIGQKLIPVSFGIYFGVVNVLTFALYAYAKAAHDLAEQTTAQEDPDLIAVRVSPKM